MRIANPETGEEFYISRIKENNPPKYIDRIKPVELTIEHDDHPIYCNPHKSQYAYILITGTWYACRNLKILDCVGISLHMISEGLPFKARPRVPLVQEPVVEQPTPQPRTIRVLKRAFRDELKNKI